MPSKTAEKRGETRPTKSVLGQRKFASGGEIRRALNSDDQNSLIASLTALRNQLTIRTNEHSVGPQDERLLLVKEWLEGSPGADNVFSLLSNSHQNAITTLAVSILACLITLLSSHFVYQSLGQPIVQSLTSSRWMRKLETYVSSSQTDLTLVTLKLLNSMSEFSGGREQKGLMQSFTWDAKAGLTKYWGSMSKLTEAQVFNKLLFMRRKGKTLESHDMLAKPDIRTLSVLFILSFVSPSSSAYVKVTFLEQHRDILNAIFKGLNQDPYSVARKVLEVCWSGIWQDPKIKRTLKVGLFSEPTLQQLLKLYDRTAQEGSDVEHIPADLIHHFMLAICTHRGVGLCFTDRGWYPRVIEEANGPNDDVEGSATHRGGKIYNKILAHVLKSLKPNENPRQQELAIKILQACPELVAGYWQAAPPALEPRLSSKWLANIAFFGAVISLPVPADSFLLPATVPSTSSTPTLYQPSPPPLSNIMENVLPSLALKLHFTKGLQAPSALVQHSTAIALAKCLVKCEDILATFRRIRYVLEEDERHGQWAKRTSEVEREVRKRVPEFQVIVAFSQQKTLPIATSVAPHASAQLTKSALLSEVAQRLMWLYHRCVPSMVAEARFDVGKALQTFMEEVDEPVEGGEATATNFAGLERLRQLHVLRMLKESDQFLWSGKTLSSRSNVYILFKLFIRTQLPAVRNALASLLGHVLSDSLMFQHDPEELQTWLDALPSTFRAVGSEAPDGTTLTDEGESVVAFLDDCMQRFAKTPYRYMEDLAAFLTPQDLSSMDVDGAPTSPDINASPLIMTLIEQLAAKFKTGLLSASDILALATYIRKLLIKLLAKQPDAQFVQAVEGRLTVILAKGTFASAPVVDAAVQREIALLRSYVQQALNPISSIPSDNRSSAMVLGFVAQVEAVPIPQSLSTRRTQAYELVDWLRFLDEPLHANEVERLAAVIERFHRDALADFYFHLNPQASLLWEGLDLCSHGAERLASIPFEYVLLHTTHQSLVSPKRRDVLIESLKARPVTLGAVNMHLGLFAHRLRKAESHDIPVSIAFIADIVQHAISALSTSDQRRFKNFLFSISPTFKNFLCETGSSCPELVQLISSLLDPTNDADQGIATEICSHWRSVLLGAFTLPCKFDLGRSLVWIKYLSEGDILRILDNALQATQAPIIQGTRDVVEETLAALASMPSHSTSSWLQLHLPNLLTLREFISTSTALEKVIAEGVYASIPLGHDGLPADTGYTHLSVAVSLAQSRWSLRLSPLPDLDLLLFLRKQTWSEQLSNTVSGLIYRSRMAQNTFAKWLNEGNRLATVGIQRLAPPVHALLETRRIASIDDVLPQGEVAWPALFTACSTGLLDPKSQSRERVLFARCTSLMLEASSHHRAPWLQELQDRVLHLADSALTVELLDLAFALSGLGGVADNVVEAVIDLGLRWSVDRLSEQSPTRDSESLLFQRLCNVIELRSNVAVHYAEPVLEVSIRHHLLSPDAMKLAALLFSFIVLKPISVNKYLQTILQHPQLHHLSLGLGTELLQPARGRLVGLLHALFHRHPANTCQPTHIQPLMTLYGGTLSTPDRKILSIFRLYERERKSSAASVFSHWSSNPSNSGAFQTCLDAIMAVNPSQILRTCLDFPVRRSMEIGEERELRGSLADGQIYDPVFILLLYSQAMLDGPPKSALSWVELFRTNVISLIVRTLSSKDPALRGLAVLQLTSLWNLLKPADMQEKEQIVYVLGLLRDLLPPPSDAPVIRLPSYTTLVLAHAIRGIFYPSNFIYPITARFLLQRPEFDPTDVPLLYGMLYSNSDDWKKERGWIIKFLSDGLLGANDWRLFKRRHTWDLLASLFQSTHTDRTLRHGVLEVLASLTCVAQATTSLVLKSSLIQWIEAQLSSTKPDETTAWLKILENISVTANADQLEGATKGGWRAGIYRCLCALSHGADINHLGVLTRVILRLALLPYKNSRNLTECISRAVEVLQGVESGIGELEISDSVDVDEMFLHHGHSLHQVLHKNALQTWGECVENLWQAVMACESKDRAWDSLSLRLLVWRSMVGERRTNLGEWMRGEVIHCLSSR